MSLWGGIATGIGGLANFFGQQDANAANRDIAGQQMEFQRNMSNTAHQREVKDLMAAGLNPNLSAGGNGSSTPTGASATMQAPQIDLPAILQVSALDQNQQKIDIEKKNAEVDQALKIAETGKKPHEVAKIKQEIESSRAGVKKTQADTRLKQKGAIRADVEGEAAGMLGGVMNWLKKGFQKHLGNSQPPGSASRPENRPFIDDGWTTNSANPDN